MRIAVTIAALALAFAAHASPGGDGPRCAGAKGPVDLAVCSDPRAAAADRAMSTVWSGHVAGLRGDARAKALDGQRGWLSRREAMCSTATDVPGCVASMTWDRKGTLTAMPSDGANLLGGQFLTLGADKVRFAILSTPDGEDIVGKVGGRVVYRRPTDRNHGGYSAVIGTARFPGRDAAVLSEFSGGTMLCYVIDVLARDADGHYGSANLGDACAQDPVRTRVWVTDVGVSMLRDATPIQSGRWSAWFARDGDVREGEFAFEPVPFTTMSAVGPGVEPLDVAEFHHAVTSYGGGDSGRLLAALWHVGGSGYDDDPQGMSSVGRYGPQVAVTACGASFDGTRSFCGGATALALYEAGAFRFAVADTSLPGVADPAPANRAFHPPLAFWKPTDLARLAPWWAATARYEAGE